MNQSLNYDVLLDLESLEPYVLTLFYEKRQKKNLILWPLSKITTFVTDIQTHRQKWWLYDWPVSHFSPSPTQTVSCLFIIWPQLINYWRYLMKGKKRGIIEEINSRFGTPSPPIWEPLNVRHNLIKRVFWWPFKIPPMIK